MSAEKSLEKIKQVESNAFYMMIISVIIMIISFAIPISFKVSMDLPRNLYFMIGGFFLD